MRDKAYYLSLQELFLLLGQSGMDSFFGFSDAQAAQASETELFCSLHRMTRKGMLCVRNEALCPEEGLQKILQTICRSFRCVIVRFADPLRLPVCFYAADAVVQAELAETAQNKTVRLRYLENEAYDQALQDLLMQAGGSAEAIETEEPEWTPTVLYLARKGLSMPSTEITALDAILWTTEFYDIRRQELTFRCCLLDESLQKMLLRMTSDDTQMEVYSASSIKRLAEQGRNQNA